MAKPGLLLFHKREARFAVTAAAVVVLFVFSVLAIAFCVPALPWLKVLDGALTNAIIICALKYVILAILTPAGGRAGVKLYVGTVVFALATDAWFIVRAYAGSDITIWPLSQAALAMNEIILWSVGLFTYSVAQFTLQRKYKPGK